MYIRQTTTQRKSDGVIYQTYRLVESTRIGNKVRQHTLLNLGSHYPIPRKQWGALTDRIDGILHHQSCLFPPEPDIEEEAQRLAAKLIVRNKEYAPSEDAADFRTVNVDSLQHSQLRSVGVESMAYDAFQALDLDRKLAALGLNGAELAAVTGTIIGRMAAPGSELSTHTWLQQVSGLGELINYDFDQCSLARMYRVSDVLLKHKDALEAHLFERERTLFNLDCTITLYDLTNTFFEGTAKGISLAAYGRSKEKRSDCPLVTLGLVLDSSGFPHSSKVFKGNPPGEPLLLRNSPSASEPATLQEMVETLETSGSNPLIVMDAGIATEDGIPRMRENLAWLKEKGYRYLVVSRKRHKEWDEKQSCLVRKKGDNEVRIYSKHNDKTDETELYCRSSLRAAKEEAMDSQCEQRFVEKIQALADGLSKKGCTKNYDKVMIAIGRLKQKYARVAQYYDIKLTKAEKGPNAISLSFERINHETKEYAGVYCLHTNIPDWDDEQLWRTYIMLTDLEAVFRSMKSELGMRPVYHQKNDRMKGHLWITLLAYHLVHYIRLRMKDHDNHDSWETLRKTMHTHMRLTTTMRTKKGDTLHIRKASRPEAWQQTIYNALGLSHNPGGTIKTIIADRE